MLSNKCKNNGSQVSTENNYEYEVLHNKIKEIVSDYNEISSMFQKDNLSKLGGYDNNSSSYKNSNGKNFDHK